MIGRVAFCQHWILFFSSGVTKQLISWFACLSFSVVKGYPYDVDANRMVLIISSGWFSDLSLLLA